jgi:hypothetical protein
MADPTTAHILGLFVSGVATLVSRIYENPRNEYLDKMEGIQEHRLDNVCGELGPVVALAIKAVQNSEIDDSPEDLTGEDKAAFFLRQSISNYEGFDDLQESIDDFYEPKDVYQDARNTYEASLKWFVLSFITIAISAILNLLINDFDSNVILGFGISFFLVGAYHTWRYISVYRDELNEMCEEAELDW